MSECVSGTYSIYQITPMSLVFVLLLSSETTKHQYNFISIAISLIISTNKKMFSFSVVRPVQNNKSSGL